EHLGDLGGLQAGGVAEQVVGLGDQLHVGVLDAVVHHLHEVPGAVGADVGAAGRPVHLGGDVLQGGAEGRVGLGGAARHDAGAVQGPFLPAGDAGSDEVDALFAQGGLAAAGVGEVRAPAVDDHVAGLQERGELADHRVGRGAGLHHAHQAAGPLQGGDELLGRVRGKIRPLVSELFYERLGPRGGTVVPGDGMTVPGQVA